MKAIKTKYYGPTNTKPSKIVASDSDGNKVSISVGDANRDPRRAAEMLMDKLGSGDLIGGELSAGVEVFTIFDPIDLIRGETDETTLHAWLKFGEAADLPHMAHNCRVRLAELGN